MSQILYSQIFYMPVHVLKITYLHIQTFNFKINENSPLCNLGDLFGEASLDWMAVFFACFGLLEAVCGGGCWAAEAVTWGWEGPSLILLNADGEGKLVSLLKLTELSLPIDLTQKLRLFKNDLNFQKIEVGKHNSILQSMLC